MNKEIEKGFQTTSLLLFGERLEGLDDYADWLRASFRNPVIKVKSRVSEALVFVPQTKFFNKIKYNLVKLEESLELGKNSLSEEDVQRLSLANASELLAPIKTTTCEIVYSTNLNTENCACYGPTQNCYESAFAWFDKDNAYSFMPRTSENVYGCYAVIDCKFSIHCYNSAKLTRCFEVSESNNCSDCLFCYNCENVNDSMFCFNTKSKRYAIANIEVGKETFVTIKKLLVGLMAKELKETKRLGHGILDL
jgi:hypothetical protein